MALKHQHLCLQHSLITQWEVNSHLVTIEVCIERCTCQWMQLNSFTFNKFRLERLNTKTVKCRGTVQHNWVTLHYILKDIPNYRLTTVYNLLSTLYSLYNTALNELTNNEWLVKLCCHQLRQTALTHLQLWTNDNY